MIVRNGRPGYDRDGRPVVLRSMDDLAPEARPAFACCGAVLTIAATEDDREYSTLRTAYLPVDRIVAVATGEPLYGSWPCAVLTMRDGSRVRCLADAADLAAMLWSPRAVPS